MRPVSVKWYRLLIIAMLRARDGDACGICGYKVDDQAASVDHISALYEGGELLDPKNVQLAHLACNKRKARPALSKDPELYALYRKWKDSSNPKSRRSLYERHGCEII